MPEQSRNPYIAGRAVRGPDFFGRHDILRAVLETLNLPQQNIVVLFGQRRIGKTSILLQLREELPKDRFAPVHFDLMDKASLPVEDVIRALAEKLAAEFGLPAPDPNQPFDFEHSFLPALYTALAPRRPVVLLDEFDVMDYVDESLRPRAAAANEFFPYLRGLIERESKLAFVIVVGRKAEDLSTEAVSVFKSAPRRRVSVLPTDEARTLILAAEHKGYLRFNPDAVERIMALTSGHPYLIQLLCLTLFNHARSEDKNSAIVTAAMVDAVAPQVLEESGNIFEWIWRGLTPAEKITFSALAALLPDENAVASHKQIRALLEENRLRVVSSDLELAPQNLVKSELLRQDDHGYRFFVELLRRWVAEAKPLAETSQEISQIDPRAEKKFQAAKADYESDDLPAAIEGFRQALKLNDAHLEARLALAQALNETDDLDEAIEEYEIAYRQSESLARSGLLVTLLRRAATHERAADWPGVVADCDRVLTISETEPGAKERRVAALTRMGDAALKSYNFDEADRLYTLAGVRATKTREIQFRRYQRDLELQARRHQRDVELMRKRYARTTITLLSALAPVLVIGLWFGFSLGNGFPQVAAFLRSPTPTLTLTATATPPTPTMTATTTPTLTPSMAPSPRPSVEVFVTQDNPVFSVAFSPDGSLLASGSSDNTIKIWDVSTEQTLRTLPSHTNWVRSVAFSPDGSLLASGSNDKTIRIWDVSTGQTLRILPDHVSAVWSVAFSPDGSLLASGSGDDTIKIWDVSTGKVLHTLFGHSDSVYSVAFSPNSSQLASSSNDHTVRIWDVSTGQQKTDKILGVNYAQSVTFSPEDKSLLAFGLNDGRIYIWDLSPDDAIHGLFGHGGQVHSVAFSPDGSLLASGSNDDTIKIWDVFTGQMLRTLSGHSESVLSVVFSPDGSLLASGSNDGSVRFWNLAGYSIFTPTPAPTLTLPPTLTPSATITPPPTAGPTATPTPTFMPTPTLPLPPTFTPAAP